MDAMCLLWPIVSNIWTRSVLRKRIFEMDSLSIFLGIGISIYFLVGFGWVCIIESTLNWFLAATLSKRASVGNVFLSPSYQRSYSLSNCPFIPFTRKFTTKWPGIGAFNISIFCWLLDWSLLCICGVGIWLIKVLYILLLECFDGVNSVLFYVSPLFVESFIAGLSLPRLFVCTLNVRMIWMVALLPFPCFSYCILTTLRVRWNRETPKR